MAWVDSNSIDDPVQVQMKVDMEAMVAKARADMLEMQAGTTELGGGSALREVLPPPPPPPPSSSTIATVLHTASQLTSLPSCALLHTHHAAQLTPLHAQKP
jgi:hypothetical protein